MKNNDICGCLCIRVPQGDENFLLSFNLKLNEINLKSSVKQSRFIAHGALTSTNKGTCTRRNKV